MDNSMVACCRRPLPMPLIWSTVNAHIKQVWGSANEQSILPAVYLCRCVNGQGPGINVKTSSGVVTVLPRAISTRHRVSYAISQGLLDMIGCATIRITPTEASVCFKSICILPVESCISSHSTLLSRGPSSHRSMPNSVQGTNNDIRHRRGLSSMGQL